MDEGVDFQLMMMKNKILLQNRKVNYDYNILYSLEAGIVLHGSEVKSLRTGKAGIVDSFVYPRNGEAYIHNFYIANYVHTSSYQHDNYRVKKLLLHKREINKLIGQVKKTGVSIVPVKVYLNKKNIIKLEIAVVTGKKKFDKRQVIKKREWDRKKSSILKHNVS